MKTQWLWVQFPLGKRNYSQLPALVRQSAALNFAKQYKIFRIPPKNKEQFLCCVEIKKCESKIRNTDKIFIFIFSIKFLVRFSLNNLKLNHKIDNIKNKTSYIDYELQNADLVRQKQHTMTNDEASG